MLPLFFMSISGRVALLHMDGIQDVTAEMEIFTNKKFHEWVFLFAQA